MSRGQISPFVPAKKTSTYGYKSLDEAFPPVESGLKPFGSKVLVQMRTPKKRSEGGILLTDETVAIDRDNTQVAKVIAVGPLAFCNRDTLKPWPEGAWCKIGDYVRVPKYGNDMWSVPISDMEERAHFQLVSDLAISGLVIDPLQVVSFI